MSSLSHTWKLYSKWARLPASALREGYLEPIMEPFMELPRNLNRLFTKAVKAERKEMAERELARQKRMAKAEAHLASFW
ncbi:alpha-mannosidase [Chlorella sorokiniana]|uniref:Alpha-mannosidase n=1 Tax=Chlorella sorokiniana TaxID=3076 RepID=A0A2P6TZM9_CHLSO|nr:alpha-mannosidase [Chlorella sorokiniana]|eukprot:PRW59522.1 alpha-mannosidase [Chlorella sorokiniana]